MSVDGQCQRCRKRPAIRQDEICHVCRQILGRQGLTRLGGVVAPLVYRHGLPLVSAAATHEDPNRGALLEIYSRQSGPDGAGALDFGAAIRELRGQDPAPPPNREASQVPVLRALRKIRARPGALSRASVAAP